MNINVPCINGGLSLSFDKNTDKSADQCITYYAVAPPVGNSNWMLVYKHTMNDNIIKHSCNINVTNVDEYCTLVNTFFNSQGQFINCCILLMNA